MNNDNKKKTKWKMLAIIHENRKRVLNWKKINLNLKLHPLPPNSINENEI